MEKSIRSVRRIVSKFLFLSILFLANAAYGTTSEFDNFDGRYLGGRAWWDSDASVYTRTLDYSLDSALGATCMKVDYNKNGQLLAYFGMDTQCSGTDCDASMYDTFSFMIKPLTGPDVVIRVRAADTDGDETDVATLTTSGTAWQRLNFDIAAVDGQDNFNLNKFKKMIFIVAPDSTTATGSFLLDEIQFFDATLDAPTLNTITDPDKDGNYDVSWNTVSGATLYEIWEERRDANFADASANAASGWSGNWPSGTTQSYTNTISDRYYYHIRSWTAAPENGGACSLWSTVESHLLTRLALPEIDNFDGRHLGNPNPTWWDSDGPTVYNRTYQSTENVYSGTYATKVVYDKSALGGVPWAFFGIDVGVEAYDFSHYSTLTLKMKSLAPNVSLLVKIGDNEGDEVDLGTWTTSGTDYETCTYSLSAAANNPDVDLNKIQRILFFIAPGSTTEQGTIYLDEIQFVDTSISAPAFNAISDPEGDNNYDVTWSTITGASLYEIWQDESSMFENANAFAASPPADWSANWPSGTIQNYTNTPGNPYYFKVRSWSDTPENGGVCSSWSTMTSKVQQSFYGVVADMVTANPISGVVLEVIDMSTGTPLAETLTNTSGEYVFYNLPAGNYRINVKNAGQFYLPTYIDMSHDGLSESQMNMSLRQAGVITGNVTLPDSSPAQSITVVAINQYYQVKNVATTDALGDYSMSVEPGTTIVAAYPLGTFYSIEFYDLNNEDPADDSNAQINWAEARQLDVVALQQYSESLDFQLALGGKIYGTIRDGETNNPVTVGIGLMVGDEEGEMLLAYDTSLNQDPSQYELPVPYGTYTLEAAPYGPPYLGLEYPGTITLDAQNNNIQIDVPLPKGGTIGGNISYAGSGDPITSGVGLWLIDANDESNVVAGAIPEEDGTYSFQAEFGTYKVTCFSFGMLGPPANVLPQFYNGVDGFSSATEITISELNPYQTAINFSMVPGGVIHGNINDGQNGIEGIDVIAENTADPADVHTVQTDANGNYDLGSLNDGSYYIRASGLGYLDEYYSTNTIVNNAYITKYATSITISGLNEVYNKDISVATPANSPIQIVSHQASSSIINIADYPNTTISLEIDRNAQHVFTVEDSLGTVVFGLNTASMDDISETVFNGYDNSQNPLAAGDYTYFVSVTDQDENQAQVSGTLSIDLQAPDVPTINAVATPTNQTTQTISGIKTEDTSVIEVTCNTATVGTVSYPTTTTWQCTLTEMDENDNLISAIAKDALNNESTGVQTTIVVDTTAPDQPTVNEVTTPTNQTEQTISGTKTEDTAVIEVVCGTATVGAVSYPTTTTWQCTLTEMGQGDNTISITAKDALNNESTAATTTIFVDSICDTPFINPPSTPTNQTEQTISGTKTEDAIVIEVACGTATVGTVSYPTTTTWECTLTEMNEGDNNISVTAEDTLNNESTAAVATIFVDSIAPDQPTINAVTTPTNQTEQTISGTKAEDAAVIEVTCSTATVGTVSYPTTTTWQCTLTDMGQGDNSISVTAEDTLNNESTAAVATIFVDSIAPDQPTINVVTTPTNQTEQTISGTKTEDAIVIEVTCSTATVGTVSYPTTTTWQSTLTDMDEGDNNISITAKDALNNESTEGTDSIFVDSIAPDQPTINAVTTPTNQTEQTISGTKTEDTALIEVVCSTATVGTVSYPTTTTWQCALTDMDEDNNNISITAKDALNNESTEETATIFVDSIAPVISNLYPTDGLIVDDPSMTITGNVSEACSVFTINGTPVGLTDLSFSYPITLVENENTIQIIADDLLGNQHTNIVNVYYDIQPPANGSLAITEGDYTTQRTVNLSLSATDLSSMQMLFSEDETFADKTEGDWQPYATTATYTFENGTEEIKTIYGKFRDAFLRESAVVSDSITYSFASINGQVVDALDSNQKIDNIWVVLASEDQSYWVECLTDAQGFYTFDGVAPGSYKLGIVEADKFHQPEFYNNRPDFFNGDLITYDGTTPLFVDFALDRAGAISGQVTDDGNPAQNLEGMGVFLYVNDGVDNPPAYQAYTQTDVDGKYTFGSLEANAYQVEVNPIGYDYGAKFWDDQIFMPDADWISVVESVENDTINFILSEGTTISGIITDQNTGQTVKKNVYIDVRGDSVDKLVRDKWNTTGNYTIENVPLGSYKVVARSKTDVFGIYEYYSEASSFETATVVNASTSNPVSGIDFTLDIPVNSITDISADSQYISPNNDGVSDTVSLNATSQKDSIFILEIQDSSSNVIKQNQTAIESDSYSFVWDGTNDSDTVVTDGDYTYYLKAEDEYGIQTTSVNGTFTVDTVEPLACSISIDEGESTDDTEVHLTLSASDTNSIQMKIGEGDILNDGSIPWENYQTTYIYILPDSVGQHQLNAVFKDAAGNISDVISDTITFTPPAPVQTDTSAFITGIAYHSRTLEPLSGVRVHLKGQIDSVYTDVDGKFKYPINQPAFYIIDMEKTGYVFAQRIADVKELAQYFAVEPAYMTPVDTQVTTITSAGGTATDSTGKISIDFPAGAVSSSIDVSSVWFEHGRELPGMLPVTSQFTYAMELYPDGAEFTTPVTIRFENTHGFSPGTEIPVGYYNREKAMWEHETMGQVDATGQFVEYQVMHFSPRDCNLPTVWPTGSKAPGAIENITLENNQFKCNSDKEAGNSLIDLARGRLYIDHSIPGVKSLYGDRELTFTYNSSTANPVKVIGVKAEIPDGDYTTPISSSFTIAVRGFRDEVKFDGMISAGLYKYIYDCTDENGEKLPTGTYFYQTEVANEYFLNYATARQFGGAPLADTGVQSPWKRSIIKKYNSKFIVDNQQESPWGSGWGLEELHQLVFDQGGRIEDSLILTSPEGIIRKYVSAEEIRVASIAIDGSPANDASEEVSVSGDGRYIAFASEATNLVEGDTNGNIDIFVYDTFLNQIERVSVSSDGDQSNYNSSVPSISSDGRYVAFRSYATNLVAGDTNGVADIFVYDRAISEIKRVSVSSAGDQADNASSNPHMSGNGRYVAFDTGATNLVEGINTDYSVLVHDLITSETKIVSIDSSGEKFDTANTPCINEDGRYIAFKAFAVYANILSYSIMRHDTVTGETIRVNWVAEHFNDCDSPSISADGRYVAFSSECTSLVPGDTNGKTDIFVYDTETHSTKRISVSSEGDQSNSHSGSPSISADGRYVSYNSYATNLVSDDTNGTHDVFVYDVETSKTKRVSVSCIGEQGGGSSYLSSISADGRHIGFQSDAGNLVNGDTNGLQDIFIAPNRLLSINGDYISPEGNTSKLNKNADDTYTLTYKDGTTITFDADGYQTARTDTNGNVTAYQWVDQLGDGDKELDKIIDPGNLQYSFYYDANEKIESMTDPAGRTTYFTVDTNGDLTGIQNPDTSIKSFTYDTKHLMETKTTEEGDISTYIWDEYGFLRECLSPTRNIVTVDNDGIVSETLTQEHHYYLSELETGSINLLSAGEGTDANLASSVPYAQTYSTSRFDSEIVPKKVRHSEYRAPIERIDQLGRVTKLSYDDRNDLIEKILPSNAVISYEYDGNKNRTKKTLEDIDATTEYTYDETFNKVTSINNALDNTFNITYDAYGNVDVITDPYSKTIDLDYDSRGLVRFVEDRKNNTTEYVYDSTTGRLTDIIYPLVDGSNPQVHITYDTYGNIDTITDEENHVTDYDYNSMNRLVKITDAENKVTEFDYYDNGLLKTVQDGELNVTTYFYNSVKSLEKILYPNGASEEFYYNERRYLTLVKQIGNGGSPVLLTKYVRNAAGEVTRVINPEGNVRDFTYTVLGDVDTATEYDDLSNSLVTDYDYDILGRLETITDPLLKTIGYTYDKLGNVKTLTDQNDNITSFDYDDLNRLWKTTYEDATYEELLYDDNGNLTDKRDRKGDHIDYDHDVLNRLILKTYPDASTISYQYFKNSLLKAVTGGGDTYNFTYFDNNWLASEGKTGEVVSYTYDNAGNMDVMTYPDSTTVDYDHNNMNAVSTIAPSWMVQDFGYTFDDLGRIDTLTFPNGIEETRAYNNNSQIASINSKLGLTDINQFIYAYNSRDLRESVTTLRGLEEYEYDELSRLTQVIYPTTPSVTVEYDYDDAGNRTEVRRNGVAEHSYATANSLNQYPTIDSITQTYDDNGSLTGDGTNNYSYDYDNRLVGVNTNITYDYDLLGRRKSKTVDSVTTNFVYSGNQVIMDKDGSGTVTAKYVYGAGMDDVLNVDKSGTQYFYHKDGLNSVSEITDSTGAIVERYTYEVYGDPTIWNSDYSQELTDSTIANRHMFTGQLYDKEAELYDYKNRAYSGKLGRFLQTDPVGYYDSANLYTYVDNNPTNYIDPFGLCKDGAPGGPGSGNNGGNNISPSDDDDDVEDSKVDDANEKVDKEKNKPKDKEKDKSKDKQDKKLSKGEIKKLKDAGIDIHELKGGKNASKRDLFKDAAGNIKVKPKDGSGPGDPTGLNINDF